MAISPTYRTTTTNKRCSVAAAFNTAVVWPPPPVFSQRLRGRTSTARLSAYSLATTAAGVCAYSTARRISLRNMKLPVDFAILRRCGSTSAKVDHVGIPKDGAGGPGKLVAVVVKVDRKKAGRQ